MELVRPIISLGLLALSDAVDANQGNDDGRIGVKQKDQFSETEEWTDPFTYPNGTRKVPPEWYKDGPMPTISDSLFSLIILIYVGVIFVFMFFAFCWKEPEPPPPDPAHKNIPMITSMLEEMEKAEAAAKAAEIEAQESNENNEEGTEMKDLNKDKVNVVSETSETPNEAATSV